MATLSLCMIVKNEEDVLDRCLNCVKDIADEIIIVDTGSTDNTKNIAERYTRHIYDFTWIDDFSAARNASFAKATMDYVMWLDADDVIDEQNQAKLKHLITHLKSDVDMVMLRYDVAFDANDHPTLSYYRERIFKRSNQYQWIGEIHEVIAPQGNILHQDIVICHRKLKPTHPRRNLNIFKRMLEDGKTLDPRQQFYYARELSNNGYTEQAIEEFNRFLESGNGWIENNISACADLATCYRRLQNGTMALQSLYRSFLYDLPRAEICCEIGKHFMDQCEYPKAIFWYKMATDQTYDEKSGGFHAPDCYGYIPCIQLCVCYDRMGDYQNAIHYNELAASYKPENESVLLNRAYFKRCQAEGKE